MWPAWSARQWLPVSCWPSCTNREDHATPTTRGCSLRVSSFFLPTFSICQSARCRWVGSLRGGSKGRRRAYMGIPRCIFSISVVLGSPSGLSHLLLMCYSAATYRLHSSLNHDAKIRPFSVGFYRLRRLAADNGGFRGLVDLGFEGARD
jgi:hypothetical protein